MSKAAATATVGGGVVVTVTVIMTIHASAAAEAATNRFARLSIKDDSLEGVWKMLQCCVVLVDDAQPGVEQSLPQSLEDHILWQSRQSVFSKTAATHHHSATRCCCTRNRFTQNQPLTGGLFVCDLWPPEFNRQHTATHPPTVFNRRLCTVHSGIGLLEIQGVSYCVPCG